MSPQVLELIGRINTLHLAPAACFQNSRSDERLAAPAIAIFSSHYAFFDVCKLIPATIETDRIRLRVSPFARPVRPEVVAVGVQAVADEAAGAGRGVLPQGAPALILMGDWCAVAQPISENQACGELNDWEDRFGREGNTTSVVGFCSFLLTGWLMGDPPFLNSQLRANKWHRVR